MQNDTLHSAHIACLAMSQPELVMSVHVPVRYSLPSLAHDCTGCCFMQLRPVHACTAVNKHGAQLSVH